MSRDLRELLHETATAPSRPIDLDELAAGARRRGRQRMLVAGAGTLTVLLLAALVVPGALGGGDGGFPHVADQPDPPAVEIPDGWVTVTAGELAVSVPPDWDVDVRGGGDEPANAAMFGGPCGYDLVPGTMDDDPGTSRAVVYQEPTGGVCAAIGHGPPDRPGLVLYTTMIGDVDGVPDQRGVERNLAGAPKVRERVGAIEAWRILPSEVPDAGPEDRGRAGDEVDGDDAAAARAEQDDRDALMRERIVTYVAAELEGGFWVAMPDDPVTQQVLATVRPAEGAVPRERPLTTGHRDLEAPAWEVLATRASREFLGGGRVLADQAAMDDFWPRLHFEDDPPTVPEGRAAIAGASYAGGLPGGCHQQREVVGVRIHGLSASILLGDLAPGWGPDDCSDEAIVYLVAVPPDAVEHLNVVSAWPVDEWGGPAHLAPGDADVS